ncbi:hypothetical protein HPB52_025484 [Rhipicephalus sanguineus]|uniref:Uncharacterized protein n=1 Tax=Rhipicephalus sanguineus TaxID=34632 RepID=A0A9D4YRF1_RHISA|nr:hypothetical protein HPB52_025484 [Rhipicephalus sanguineus]
MAFPSSHKRKNESSSNEPAVCRHRTAMEAMFLEHCEKQLQTSYPYVGLSSSEFSSSEEVPSEQEEPIEGWELLDAGCTAEDFCTADDNLATCGARTVEDIVEEATCEVCDSSDDGDNIDEGDGEGPPPAAETLHALDVLRRAMGR